MLHGTVCGVSITDASGSIGGKVRCACSSLYGNLFHIKSSVSLSSISGIPGGNSELCFISKDESCGSILSGTRMVDSGDDIFHGSSMPLLLTDWSHCSLSLNNRYRSWAFPISCP